MIRRTPTLLAVALGLVLSACASAGPKLNVIGVGQSRAPASSSKGDMLVVFVEVINTSSRPLELSRLRYQLSAETWFDTKGEVRLSRTVAASGTAVVEIPVQYQARAATRGTNGVAYNFSGKLFASDSSVERSWNVRSSGTLAEGAIALREGVIKTQIATGDDD